MRARQYESRHTATKAARRLRPAAADRLVLACEACPPSTPSRRRPPAWGRIARDVAAAVGIPAADVRHALDEARAGGGSSPATAAGSRIDVEALTMRLDDLPEDVREAVVEGIGQLGHDDTVDAIHAIADGLRDDDPEPDDDKNAS